jgi:hypothetical protein
LLKKIETDMFARKTTVGRLLGTVKRLQFLAHRSVLACRGLVVQTTLPADALV